MLQPQLLVRSPIFLSRFLGSQTSIKTNTQSETCIFQKVIHGWGYENGKYKLLKKKITFSLFSKYQE